MSSPSAWHKWHASRGGTWECVRGTDNIWEWLCICFDQLRRAKHSSWDKMGKLFSAYERFLCGAVERDVSLLFSLHHSLSPSLPSLSLSLSLSLSRSPSVYLLLRSWFATILVFEMEVYFYSPVLLWLYVNALGSLSAGEICLQTHLNPELEQTLFFCHSWARMTAAAPLLSPLTQRVFTFFSFFTFSLSSSIPPPPCLCFSSLQFSIHRFS